MMLNKHSLWILAAGAFLLSTTTTYAQTTAYSDPLYAGNQTWGGNLGLDFDVNSSILVTKLGIFDNNGDGFSSSVSVAIFNRDTAAQVGSSLTALGTAGTLVNGDRFVAITPFLLVPGHYSVVAVGFNGTDLNGNATFSGFQASTQNTGGGAITFVGNGRFDTNTTLDFPPTCVGCPTSPTNIWNAGTFQFQAVAAPTITKTFSTPNGQLNPGDMATLVFTLSNTNAIPLTGAAFTDTLSSLVVSTTPGTTDTCGGTVTAIAGSNSISLSGGTIPASGSCTITVNVINQAIEGQLTNTTSTLTTNEAPAGAAASATTFVSPMFFLWFFEA